MQFFLSYYQLKKKQIFSNGLEYQKGALLKVVDQYGHFGVADICPWPHLGDLDLDQEINQQGVLFQSAYELAKIDLNFKKNKKSLFSKSTLPINKLVTHYQNLSFGNYKNQTLKFKFDTDFYEFFDIIKKLDNSNRVRVDFNSKLTPIQFENFLQNFLKLSDEKKRIIQYVEDPTPFNFSLWQSWNKIIPLAADFVKADDDHFNQSYSFLIWKPSRLWPANKIIQNLLNKSPQNVVITSAMDHPVGIAHAMWVAQQFQVSKITGISTLDLYQENQFNKYFNLNDEQINVTDLVLNDYGIGMTADFEGLEWKKL